MSADLLPLLPLLRCPRTGQPLTFADETTLQSLDGGHRYPVVHGIPDFRLFDPPYMTREEESAIIARLAEAEPSRSFSGLIRYMVEELRPSPSRQQAERDIEHRMLLIERSPMRLDALLSEVDAELPASGVVLDLGCGSGEATAVIARRSGRVVGIDISLIELFLARKHLAEQGVHAFLVAGCGEALPFAKESFDFVYSPDVIEHVSDQRVYLGEAERVLGNGGVLVLNSPNRYSLVCPEPHVGIWFLTCLPRPMIDPVCRLMGQGPYIGKRLLSLAELRALMRETFPNARITARRPNPGATGLFGRLYRDLAPLSTGLFAHVDAQHLVRATKQGAEP